MSLSTIKSSLETYLNDNLADVAIKWGNTQTYTMNGDVLTDDEVDDLDLYVEPLVIPLSDDEETLSSVKGYKNTIIFQLATFGRTNKGMGAIISNSDLMKGLYRGKVIDEVRCESTKYLPSFPVDEWVVMPLRITAYLRTT